MAYIPILFNTEMVQAIMDGRKTQTRRLMKLKYKENEAGFQILTNKHDGKFAYAEYYDEDENPTRLITPPCMPGSILWVRETWDNIPVSPGGHFRFGGMYYYRADGDIRPEGWQGNWHPSIHMPKEAARIFLRVKDVRVERLKDISVDDCKREGIWDDYKTTSEAYHDALVNAAYPKCFAGLWDSTIKPADRDKYGWNANPWVWVIEFEKCERPEGWCTE